MRRKAVGACALAMVLLNAGCGQPPLKLVPVSGNVKLAGKPIPSGAISFAPDVSKNNSAKVNPLGAIHSDGTYQMTTDGAPGVPAGWYKVTVQTEVPGMQPTAKPVKINSKFSDARKTPLSLEVVESPAPGAYDLNVTK